MKRATLKEPIQRPTFRQRVRRFEDERWSDVEDTIAVEEPLEIRLRFGGKGAERRLGLVMRTPDQDRALSAGLLFAEGIVHEPKEIRGFDVIPAKGEGQEFNSVLVKLAPRVNIDWAVIERPLVMNSACGVCGRAVLSHLRKDTSAIMSKKTLSKEVLQGLPAALRKHQQVFEATGGLHAAGLFDFKGNLLLLREDVGRHNAVDKIVGSAFLDGQVPLSNRILMVSGRASYEILQKAVRAGIPVVAAIGAPSSLAVDVATEFGVTLVGFLRHDRFNVYAGAGRLEASVPRSAPVSRTSRGK